MLHDGASTRRTMRRAGLGADRDWAQSGHLRDLSRSRQLVPTSLPGAPTCRVSAPRLGGHPPRTPSSPTAFNTVSTAIDVKIITTPVRAPRTNAIIERFVGSVQSF